MRTEYSSLKFSPLRQRHRLVSTAEDSQMENAQEIS